MGFEYIQNMAGIQMVKVRFVAEWFRLWTLERPKTVTWLIRYSDDSGFGMYLERREEFPGPIFLCSLELDRSFFEEELPEVQREHNDEGRKAIPKK